MALEMMPDVHAFLSINPVMTDAGPSMLQSWASICHHAPLLRQFEAGVTNTAVIITLRCLKGLAQAKIIKKSVILFWVLNMSI